MRNDYSIIWLFSKTFTFDLNLQFILWNSLHARVNTHYKAWSIKYIYSLWNSGAMYVGNKTLRQFQNFSVCFSNTSTEKPAKDSAETFVYYDGNVSWAKRKGIFNTRYIQILKFLKAFKAVGAKSIVCKGVPAPLLKRPVLAPYVHHLFNFLESPHPGEVIKTYFPPPLL